MRKEGWIQGCFPGNIVFQAVFLALIKAKDFKVNGLIFLTIKTWKSEHILLNVPKDSR